MIGEKHLHALTHKGSADFDFWHKLGQHSDRTTSNVRCALDQEFVDMQNWSLDGSRGGLVCSWGIRDAPGNQNATTS